jgi:hypothetical protein
MKALNLVQSLSTLLESRAELAQLKARIKALEALEQASEKVLLATVSKTGPVVVNGFLLGTEAKPKGVRLGDQELVTAVMKYDATVGTIVATIAEEQKAKKAKDNAANAPLVLTVTEAKETKAPLFSVAADGKMTLSC